jgi:hypothetical protein
MERSMDKYQFTLLTWLKVSARYLKAASKWYEGPGWYYNPLDKTGKVLNAKCASKAKSGEAYMALEALNHCGAEGWSVVGFFTKPDPSFILQRRTSD